MADGPANRIKGLSCCVLMSVYQGWQQVVMARFDLEKACRLIQDHGVTFAYVPPPVVLALVTHPAVGRYDLSSLRVLHAAAAPLPPGLARAVWERLGVPVKQGFGLSEASPATHIQAPDEVRTPDRGRRPTADLRRRSGPSSPAPSASCSPTRRP